MEKERALRVLGELAQIPIKAREEERALRILRELAQIPIKAREEERALRVLRELEKFFSKKFFEFGHLFGVCLYYECKGHDVDPKNRA